MWYVHRHGSNEAEGLGTGTFSTDSFRCDFLSSFYGSVEFYVGIEGGHALSQPLTGKSDLLAKSVDQLFLISTVGGSVKQTNKPWALVPTAFKYLARHN